MRKNLLPATTLLGFRSNPGTIQEYLEFVISSVDEARSVSIYYLNLHSLYCYFTDNGFKPLFDNKVVWIDGMPLIWLYNLFGIRLTRENRYTCREIIYPLLSNACESGWQVFYIGQASNTHARALAVIRRRFPTLQIEGHSGYFDQTTDSAETTRIIEQINSHKTTLLLVGLGSPRQENWVHSNRNKIDAPVVWCMGACMEMVAGDVKTPPQWMGNAGLEWVYRFIGNPRRFAFRYLIEPIVLAIILFRNIFRHGFQFRVDRKL